jgi:anaerobic selenocysteine-containing dehydrogenase
MCACRCGIDVTVKNGEVRYIEGNPNHPINKGVICAKGSSGIMKQYSPARLTKPLKRIEGAERGTSSFEEIEWDEAFDIMEKRLSHIRSTDPKKFALFTGRDQMQALTGLFAKQYGTPNYAAHGGFCSVNMAAGMIYTIGGSFWEFGGPDLDHAKLFIMIGTAEDHHSNPLKIELSKFKRAGGKFISINPVRTGYSSIADEWVPIKPGTDGALFMAINHVLINSDLIDEDFVIKYTNGAELIDIDQDSETEGMFKRTDEPSSGNPCVNDQNKLIWDLDTNKAMPSSDKTCNPSLIGEFTLDDGSKVKTSFQLLKERHITHTPEWASKITGIPEDTIIRLAKEMGISAKHHQIELPITWVDSWGKKHDKVTGNPVAFHAMRGLAAHSNGFHAIRNMSITMTLLGTIDRPGGFRHKAPFPRPIPPCAKPPKGPKAVQPNTPLDGMPLGWPASPEDLFVDDAGKPVRIDKAFSWEYPLSVHGLMHNVITNAWRGDPYPLDTLMLFMSNMAWNSTMNTQEVRKMLVDKNEDGGYKIPYIIVCDAFQSETVDFADLVLPDTTYLERHDVMGMLDRPISEYSGPIDSVRVPVVEPTGECKPFQEVLIELAGRMKFPEFTDENGGRKFKNYKDFIINYETEKDSGIGFLAGWRGKHGEDSLRGKPNQNQWERYEENNCVFQHKMPKSFQYMRNWNSGYLNWANNNGLIKFTDPIQIHLYSEVLQKFKMAAQGRTNGRQPPEHLRQRVETFFDPLPMYHDPLEYETTNNNEFPLNAVTQRPMAMYHSWDSQNAWLRQIHADNALVMHPSVGLEHEFEDGDWVWVESPHGKVKCVCQFSEAVEPGTVWTWNAIGKASGAWNLSEKANESNKGFILNHLIAEELPFSDKKGSFISNSDPLTGQAGWYDVKVKVYRASQEGATTLPQFEAQTKLPGMISRPAKGLVQLVAGKGIFTKLFRNKNEK